MLWKYYKSQLRVKYMQTSAQKRMLRKKEGAVWKMQRKVEGRKGWISKR